MTDTGGVRDAVAGVAAVAASAGVAGNESAAATAVAAAAASAAAASANMPVEFRRDGASEGVRDATSGSAACAPCDRTVPGVQAAARANGRCDRPAAPLAAVADRGGGGSSLRLDAVNACSVDVTAVSGAVSHDRAPPPPLLLAAGRRSAMAADRRLAEGR